MKKNLYMFNFEFKRNIKNYIFIILSICIILTGLILRNLHLINENTTMQLATMSIRELVQTNGYLNFSCVITQSVRFVISIGYFICLLYTVVIWSKEYNVKNKSMYTLMVLPISKMKIFTSKICNIICLTYMYIICVVLNLFILYITVPYFIKGNFKSIGFCEEIYFELAQVIPFNIIDFIIIDVILLTLKISVLSMLFLFIKSTFKNEKLTNKVTLLLLAFLFMLLFVFNVEYILVKIAISNIYMTMFLSTLMIIMCYKTSSYILDKKIEF